MAARNYLINAALKLVSRDRTRTCDPLIKSAVRNTLSDHGSYDLLTFVTTYSDQFRCCVVTSLSQPYELLDVLSDR